MAGSYLFAPDWLLRNVDNRTPKDDSGEDSFVNDAWEINWDFSEENNCVAFSTSYYEPAGAADDFMWTPLIALPAGSPATLSWRARSHHPVFPDGYEVRIMPGTSGPPTGSSGVIGNQLTASTVVFSVPAEIAGVWTPHSVNVSSFVGQSVYIGFRNNSNDRFLLAVDDVIVTQEFGTSDINLAVQNPPPILPYTRVPQSLLYAPATAITAVNNGAIPATNVVGTAQLARNAVATGPIVPANTVASIAADGGSAPLTFAGALPALSVLGEWSVFYAVSASQTEPQDAIGDNAIFSRSVVVTKNELARHEGVAVDDISTGAKGASEIGVQFTIPNSTPAAGIRFTLVAHEPTIGPEPSEWPGHAVIANLRAFDTVISRPGALIASTIAGISVLAETTYQLPFAGGPQQLAAGTYVLTVSEPVDAAANDTDLRLALHNSRFEPGTTWYSPEVGVWGTYDSFRMTPAISLLTDLNLFENGFEDPLAARAAETTTAAATAPATTPKPSLHLRLVDLH